MNIFLTNTILFTLYKLNSKERALGKEELREI